MPIQIYPVQKQIKGGFNDGEIVENKPIQMSRDSSKLQPYSNIFYWAHAWADVTSTIGLHPHQAFEIMSFVLKGDIEHYDTHNKKWTTLHEGDVQIIRSGSGISHAEKLLKGSHIFQIWLDPDIEIALSQPATYDDYTSDAFPITSGNGISIKTLKGTDSPLEMQTPGITILQIDFNTGKHAIDIEKNSVQSIYIIDGEIEINNGKIMKDDFLVMRNEDQFVFSSATGGKLFIISSPEKVPYTTYAESRN